MKQNQKTTFKTFLAGNYGEEIEYLNSMSEKGWQLTHGGCFRQTFRKNDSIRYRYQLDFRKKPDDFGRYIETFREQGWEYVGSTFNGWHTFRKLYNPSLPEDEYEIYTDRESVKSLQKRLLRLMIVISAIAAAFLIYFGITVIKAPRIPTEILLIPFALLLGVGIGQIITIRRQQRKKRKKHFPTECFGAILCSVIASVFMLSRTFFSDHFLADNYAVLSPEIAQGTDIGEITIPYADFYYFDIDLSAVAPITLTVADSESGTVIYTVRGDLLSDKDIRLWFKTGTYHIYLSDFAGGKIDLNIELD